MLKCCFWLILAALLAGVPAPAQEPREGTTQSLAKPALEDVPELFKPETSYRPETSLGPPTGFRIIPGAPRAQPQHAVQVTPVDQAVEGVRVRGSLAVQPGEAPKAALLLLPEWWGLNDKVRAEAGWWAARGFKVLAFDLYDGAPVRNRGEAARRMADLKPEEVLPRLKAAVTLLAGDAKTSQPLKVGLMGFGIGATYAQRLAAADPRPGALIIFYGDLLREPGLLAQIKAPILGIFAGLDPQLTPEKIAAFKKGLTGVRLPPQTLTYQTRSGFMFNTEDQTDQGYIEQAHQKTLEFLTRELE